MAQLSTTMSQAHKATAFHFFTSNFFFSPRLLVLDDGASTSSSSTSIFLQSLKIENNFVICTIKNKNQKFFGCPVVQDSQ
ncbi:hypothetical protein FWK35_00006275, partial [Aphis craccivora]